MDSEIMVETLPLLGTCNLCLSDGVVKSMLLGNTHEGKHEIYIDMLLQCFSIDLGVLQLGDTKRLICDACITRLRDSFQFKEQIEESVKTLTSKILIQESILDLVKTEALLDKDSVVDFDDDLGDDDDVVIADSEEANVSVDMLIKKEKPDPPRTSSKKTKTKKMYKFKKNDILDTEALLEAGLFPFKFNKNKTFSCSICPEKSTNLDDIKNHITQHNKSNIHIAFNKMLVSKSQRFYKNAKIFRCKICTSDIKNFEELSEHIESCTRLKQACNWNNLPFKLEKNQLDCPVCKKTFLNFVNLNTHMNVHYPNYICENCGKAFASKARLRGHMRTHEVGTFPCQYCDLIFDRVTKRENHVSKEHKAGVRYACKRCNISLSSFYARQKHLAEVHNEELKRYKCKACPQRYITPGHLSSHVRRDHLNERNHKCEKCDQAFYTKNALKMHMIKHEGARIHTCNICQKSYQRKKTLREHMRIHNNDKRFVCPECGRAFTQKCTLKGHMRVHERRDGDDRSEGRDVENLVYVVTEVP